MSEIVLRLIAFIGVIGVLVVIHELGHYFAARWCGVKVLRFSFGFGKVLWKRTAGSDATEWVISAFPFGGYVKMLDEREAPVPPEQQHRAFNRQALGRRSLIVAAGPLANLLLAVGLYWVVFFTGTYELSPLLGRPPLGSPAEKAGIGNGEVVRLLDGMPVKTWSELRWLLLQKSVDSDQVRLEVMLPDQSIVVHTLDLSAIREGGWSGDAFDRLGVRFYRPDGPAILGTVLPSSPAERAGLLAGDEVVGLNGEPLSSWLDFVEGVRRFPGKSVRLEIRRELQLIALDLVPEVFSENGKEVGKIGVGVADAAMPKREIRVFVSYGAIEALGRAFVETKDKAIFSLLMFGKMLTGEASLKNLSGPVTIAEYAGHSARLGLDAYLNFMALVSISLGILNLLPVPVLDGGHLMYHMLEVVRRRPLSERAMEIAQYLGLGFLFALMALAFFNDLSRLFHG